MVIRKCGSTDMPLISKLTTSYTETSAKKRTFLCVMGGVTAPLMSTFFWREALSCRRSMCPWVLEVCQSLQFQQGLMGRGNCPRSNALIELQDSLSWPIGLLSCHKMQRWSEDVWRPFRPIQLLYQDDRKQFRCSPKPLRPVPALPVLSLQPISADGAQGRHLAGHLPLPQPWRLWKVLHGEDRGRPPEVEDSPPAKWPWENQVFRLENQGTTGAMVHIWFPYVTNDRRVWTTRGRSM